MLFQNILQKRMGRRRKLESKIVVKYEKQVIRHIMDFPFMLCSIKIISNDEMFNNS
jgi:hypothetical protein